MQNTHIIVQARIGSNRLYGKVLKKILKRPLIDYLLMQLKKVTLASKVILAIPNTSNNDLLEEYCNEKDIPYYRGSEDDVLSRYYHTAQLFNSKTIIRITADCPLIDPYIIDQLISKFQNSDYSYVSNVFPKRTYPKGMDTEIFSFRTLEKAHILSVIHYDKEHVTPFMQKQTTLFKIGAFTHDKDLSHHRLCVDTIEDFENIKRLVKKLYSKNSNFSFEDILHALSDQ